MSSAIPMFPSDPARVHVYLLLGQSNMKGLGVIDPEDRRPNPGVVVMNQFATAAFGPADAWREAIPPLHVGTPGYHPGGLGPADTFGREMRCHLPADAVLALVPCAVGATGIEAWMHGGPKTRVAQSIQGEERSLNLYDEALRRARLARQIGRIRGILWHQGESDRESPHNYADRLSRLVADLRSDLDDERLPFVAGELGHWIPGAAAINEQLRALCLQLSAYGVAGAAGLEGDGALHFTASAYRTLGRRYAQAMLVLQTF